MTTLLNRDRRRSRYMLDVSARWALERNSLNAISGQVASYSRASIANGFDQNGLLVPVGLNQPKYLWASFGGQAEPAILIEPPRTNIALHKRDLSNASWTVTSGTMTRTRNAKGIDGVSTSATLLTATSANATLLQTVTLASSGRIMSAFIQRKTGVGNIQMTTDGGASWFTIAITGTFAQYQLAMQTVTNPQFGFRIVTNGDAIVVDWAMNETNNTQGKQMTSPIGTVADNAGSETRSADLFYYAHGIVPQAITVYADMICLCVADPGTNFEFFDFGTTAPYFLGRFDGTTLQTDSQTDQGGGPWGAQVSVNPAYGNRVEARCVLNADGSSAAGQCINGGAEATAVQAVTQTFAAAFATGNMYVGQGAAALQMATFALRQIRVASGAQTMAYMREG